MPLAGGTLVALNVADGQLRWRAEAGGEVSAAPAVDDQVVYVATEYSGVEANSVRGTLRALSKETGITLWMRTLQSPIRGSLAEGPLAVYAGAANGSVYAFDKHTGRSVWVNQYADGFASQPTLYGDRLYIGSIGGWLLALEQKNGNPRFHRGDAGGGLLRIRRRVCVRIQRIERKAALETPDRRGRASGGCI
jgi:outer membrane protein assembly factor BamB